MTPAEPAAGAGPEAPGLDTDVLAMVARGEVEAATELLLRAFGPELIGWLCSFLPNDADAYDAFSWMSEELWRSLPRYAGRCSARAWCYMLARQGAGRVGARTRARGREQLVSHVSSIAHAATAIWNTTRARAYRRDDVYAEIRGMLDPDDQALLVLRVDRDLAWRDIAVVLLGDDADEDAVTRRASALRKQFERVKLRLRELATDRMAE